MAEGRVYIGTAGWSYADWNGIVYPPGMKTHPLAWLSQWFNTVEVNATFYRPLPRSAAESWVRLLPAEADFRFLLKLWGRFTHEDVEFSAVDVDAVRAAMEPLADAGRLGALLAQFPWSFRRTPPNRLKLARILDAFEGWPVAVEFRHASWDRPEVFEGLRERRVAICSIDQPLLHDCIGPVDAVTAPFSYVRFHGRNAAHWFQEGAGRNARYDYLYNAGELESWLTRIQAIRARTDEMFIITNNHYRGQAVVNAIELQHGLGQPAPASPLPQHLLEQYPRLKALLMQAK